MSASSDSCLTLGRLLRRLGVLSAGKALGDPCSAFMSTISLGERWSKASPTSLASAEFVVLHCTTVTHSQPQLAFGELLSALFALSLAGYRFGHAELVDKALRLQPRIAYAPCHPSFNPHAPLPFLYRIVADAAPGFARARFNQVHPGTLRRCRQKRRPESALCERHIERDRVEPALVIYACVRRRPGPALRPMAPSMRRCHGKGAPPSVVGARRSAAREA
eukprot:scaffold4_cov396-Prasinococcus_capsulatus_cf.AAC.25